MRYDGLNRISERDEEVRTSAAEYLSKVLCGRRVTVVVRVLTASQILTIVDSTFEYQIYSSPPPSALVPYSRTKGREAG